jgi:hypothetical protein
MGLLAPVKFAETMGTDGTLLTFGSIFGINAG